MVRRARSGPKSELAEVEENGSRAERQIGRMLERYGMRYKYEHPVAVVDRGKVRVWYPDFWLPEYGIVIEYVGGLGSRDYVDGVKHKKAVYEAAGYPSVFLGADSFNGYWPKRVLGQIRDILEERQRKLGSLDERI
jgi:hypothetical protein